MQHIVLTGERHVGKSTLARRVIDGLGVATGGFVTWFDDRRKQNRTLLLGDGADMRPVAAFRDNSPSVVYEDVFAGYGCELLARPAQLILMDELGRLEGHAQPFREAVLRTFAGNTHVLAVAQMQDRASWLDEVTGHPNVKVIRVTLENRDGLAEELIGYFRNANVSKML